MIPQDAVADYARSDEIYDENLVQFRLAHFLEKQKKRNRTDESFLNHLVRFLFRCAGIIPAVLPDRRRSVRQRREKPLFHSVLDGLFPAFAEQAPNRPI